MSNSIYYVYAYLREDGTPYYIGKGKDNRAFKKRWLNKPKDVSRIIFVVQGLSEDVALWYEVQLISFWGRKDTGTGILRNLTDGGEGKSGFKPSPEQNRRNSLGQLGKILPEATKRKIREGAQQYKYQVISPKGEVHTTHSLRQFCRDFDLDNSSMSKVARGERNHYKKWRVKNLGPAKASCGHPVTPASDNVFLV